MTATDDRTDFATLLHQLEREMIPAPPACPTWCIERPAGRFPNFTAALEARDVFVGRYHRRSFRCNEDRPEMVDVMQREQAL